jgi:hypothetical protein
MQQSQNPVYKPQELSDEDRHHGYVALNLIGDWDDWVKRRVESIEFVSDTSVRRSTSVDFRIRSWLPKPTLKWHGVRMHYLPLALLRKKSLTQFDLYDEENRALSLLTRDKNSAISAAALSALAQITVSTSLEQTMGLKKLTNGHADLPTGPKSIRIPRGIEDDFLRISYLPYDDGEQGQNAKEVLEEFLGQRPVNPTRLVDWQWSVDSDGMFVSNATEADWRWLLASDQRQARLMNDMAQLWIVATPVAAEVRRRRIIKFRYLEPLPEVRMQLLDRRRGITKKLRIFRMLANLEDRLEGLTDGKAGAREWRYHQASGSAAPVRITLTQKVLQGLGWRAHPIELAVPAVAEGASYHLEVQAPEGVQIRRASLEAFHEGTSIRRYTLRGARSLQRAHLYLGGLTASSVGHAVISLKPRTTTMVRALALLSLASFVALGLVRWKFGPIVDNTYGSSENVVPLLLLLPSFLAASIARSGESSMTTSMVFGLRVLANLVAVWPLAGAALLAVGRAWPPASTIWTVLLVGSGLSSAILMITWRLNGRRRPDGNSP